MLREAKAVTNQNQTTGKKEYLVALEFDAKGNKGICESYKSQYWKTNLYYL